MLTRLKDEKGLLLPDIVASLPLGVIVFLVMTMSMVNFALAYQDIREYTKLQDDLFQAIETIRYGYVQRGINTNSQSLCGLLSANQVSVTEGGSGLLMKVDINPTYPIETKVSIDGDGMIKLRGNYGTTMFSSPLTNSREIPIFPETNARLDGQLKYRILNPVTAFTPLKTDADGNVRLLGIDLKAQVRFREKRNGQSVDEDKRLNTRTINYQTKVFIGNTPSKNAT